MPSVLNTMLLVSLSFTFSMSMIALLHRKLASAGMYHDPLCHSMRKVQIYFNLVISGRHSDCGICFLICEKCIMISKHNTWSMVHLLIPVKIFKISRSVYRIVYMLFQLKIKDVHIRYEDDTTIPGQLFALGVTIDSLTAQSCDDNWMPRFVAWDSGNTSFKLIELSTFAVYWDDLTCDQLLGGLSLDQLAVSMFYKMM